MARRTLLGKILVDMKKLTPEQLEAALEFQKVSGVKFASHLLDMGWVSEEDLLRALGLQMGVPAVDLSRSIIPLSALQLIPESVANQHRIIPLMVKDARLMLAVEDPGNHAIQEELRFATGKKIEPYIALESRLKQVLCESYATRNRNPSAKFFFGERSDMGEVDKHPGGFIAVVIPPLPPTPEIKPDENLAQNVPDAADRGRESASAPAPAAGQAAPAPLGPKSTTVLVVDDEVEILGLLEKALSIEGFRVVSATRGLEALQKIKTEQPDLVLLDAMLPELHGFEICRKIKTSKNFGHVPVIMISAIYRGWRYAEDIKKNYGADDFFEKPFRLVLLMRRVRELLKAGPAQVESQLDLPTAQQAYAQGVELYKQKQYEPAEKAFRQAVAADPFSAETHYALANALLQRSQVFEAMREFEETVDLKPDMIKPLMNLAVLYQQNGFISKAAETWERALQKTADDDTKREIRQHLLQLL